MKTSELIGPALDWAVAMIQGYDCQFDDDITGSWLVPREGYLHDEKPLSSFTPSTNWLQGGQIIEREMICIYFNSGNTWTALQGNKEFNGPTPLIAAMRCYVASKLGNKVEVPEELK